MSDGKKKSKEELIQTKITELGAKNQPLFLIDEQMDRTKLEVPSGLVLDPEKQPENPPTEIKIADDPMSQIKSAVIKTRVERQNEKTQVLESNKKPKLPPVPDYPTAKSRIADPAANVDENTFIMGAPDPVSALISNGTLSTPQIPPRAPLSENAAQVGAHLSLADNLRMTQQKLREVESELDQMRLENERLFSTNEQRQEKLHNLTELVNRLEEQKALVSEQFSGEINILRDNIRDRDKQLIKMAEKIDELESRVGKDIRKVRVRERELENRLELMKVEKDSLLRNKDDALLDLKRKLDEANSEIDEHKSRVLELNRILTANNEQLSRTVRALRLALTNLESNDPTGSGTPNLKKVD